MPATPPPATRLELDRFLPYRLSVLTNTVSASIAAAYAERHDLSIPEWRVLAVLAASPGLSAAEVGARTGMDKVAVSRAVARLARSRRLRRRASRGDRRRSVLELSAAGNAVYAEIAPWALEYERRLLAALDAEEARALDLALAKLAERAAELRATAAG